MAQRQVVIWNGILKQFQAAQLGDTYLLAADTEIQGALTTSGLVNGRNIANDGTKLDLLTVTLPIDLDTLQADFTAAEAVTDLIQVTTLTDLDPIKTKVGHISVTQPVDLDALETRIEALDASVVLVGEWDASLGTFPVSTEAGESWVCTVAGTLSGEDFAVNDRIIALVDGASLNSYNGQWLRQTYSGEVTSVAGKKGVVLLEEADITDLKAYLLPSQIDSVAKLNAIVGASLLTTDAIDTIGELNTLITDGDFLAADGSVGLSADWDMGEFIVTSKKFVADSFKIIPTTGITAYAGGGQTNATQLTFGMSVVALCATPKDSVKLPVVAAGEEVIIINLGDTYVEVFPTETQAIDTLAINEPTIVMPNGSLTLRGLDATTWKTTSPQSNGWQDLEMQVTGSASGAGTPISTAFGPSGNIKQIAFGVGDSVYLAGHVPHDIKPNSKMYFHVHWSTSGVDVASVKWQINWTGVAGHNQGNFPADTIITVEEAAHGTAWRHMITEDSVGTDALEIDSLFFIELKRISNGSTDNADTVFGLFVDLHYESVQHATPNRSPDFYT